MEILLETNPFNRKVTFKLLLIMVWKEALKYSDGSVLCLSGCLKQNRFSPLSDVKSVVMKSASSANLQGLLQIEKVAPAFEWLLWDTLSSKQENLLPLTISGNASGLFMGRERKASRDDYGKLLTLGSSCLMLLKEKKPPVYGDRSCV